MGWGADADAVAIHTLAGVAINTVLANVLEGTVVTPVAIAANSLIISNITNDSDILIAGSKAGNSYMAFMVDASTGDTLLGVPTGQSLDLYVAGTKILDVAANTLAYSAAVNGGSQALVVTNTDATGAAASHAYLEAAVQSGSAGDAHVRLTTTGGQSWYMGADNSSNDSLFIGAGTVVSTNGYIRVVGASVDTLPLFTLTPWSSTTTQPYNVPILSISTQTVTYSSAAQMTTLISTINLALARTIAQNAGAVTIDKAAQVSSISPTAGASVSLTHSSAFRALTGGAAVNVSGLYVEAQTGGTAQNVQILLANGSTEPTAAPTDTAGVYAIDVSAASVLGFVEETAVVTPAGDFALTNKWIVRINGITYAVGLTTTLT